MFDRENIALQTVVEARKQKIEGEEAWQVLSNVTEIVVGRGKKFTLLDPNQDNREEILKLTLGRTGNLRAPTLKIGDRLVVGYNDEMYSQYVG